MKKKFFSATIAATLCACAISAQAFAAEILTDKSVYAENGQLISQSIESWVRDGKKISPDPNTIMPVYHASVYDYAETGIFEIAPFWFYDNNMGDQHYFSDAIDEDGNFAGRLEFAYGGNNPHISCFTSSARNKNVESVSFDLDAGRINALMVKNGLNTNCNEIKLVLVDGLGFVYYIDNGEKKILAAAHLEDVNGSFFNMENGGLIFLDDEFKANAEAELKAYNAYLEEWQKELEKWEGDPDDLVLAGGGYKTPMFKVDNTPYLDASADNPNTGGTSSALAGIALTACVIGISAAKKKKKQ